METIHFKTVDPLSQELLRGAFQKGLDLNWERYERQQPQDGFLRLGLSCPYGCMRGPCRIDPYGRGAERGICGLEKDGMVSAFLLRLVLQGVLEAMEEWPTGRRRGEISRGAPLDARGSAALSGVGGASLSTGEIFTAASMLSRPFAPAEVLVRQAVRLGLLGMGLMEGGRSGKPSSSMGCRVGYGLLSGEGSFIGMAGRIPKAGLKALLKEAAGVRKPKVRLVSLGDWLPAGRKFLPLVCTSGEAETVLSSGKLNLLVAGPGTDPGLLGLCGRLKVPVFLWGERAGAAEILRLAREDFDRRVSVPFSPAPGLVGVGRVGVGGADVGAALGGGDSGKVALIGGSDSLRQSLGHLPVELAKALFGEGCAVASWGDAAVWMVKQDLPVGILDAGKGPLTAVRSLAAAGRLADLKGVCFTGLRDCRELMFALGLSALGLKVLVAEPLPLWGSERVRTLLRESLAAAGGILAHFDHPVGADEILEWFLRS
jgi:hypothetical protein